MRCLFKETYSYCNYRRFMEVNVSGTAEIVGETVMNLLLYFCRTKNLMLNTCDGCFTSAQLCLKLCKYRIVVDCDKDFVSFQDEPTSLLKVFAKRIWGKVQVQLEGERLLKQERFL